MDVRRNSYFHSTAFGFPLLACIRFHPTSSQPFDALVLNNPCVLNEDTMKNRIPLSALVICLIVFTATAGIVGILLGFAVKSLIAKQKRNGYGGKTTPSVIFQHFLTPRGQEFLFLG